MAGLKASHCPGPGRPGLRRACSRGCAVRCLGTSGARPLSPAGLVARLAPRNLVMQTAAVGRALPVRPRPAVWGPGRARGVPCPWGVRRTVTTELYRSGGCRGLYLSGGCSLPGEVGTRVGAPG